MDPAPDLLDHLGLAISEVGAVQIAVESARLYWPAGQARVALLVQAAWSGELTVELELRSERETSRRTVRVPHGEVRRVRLPLAMPSGAEVVSLRVVAPIPASAERLRAAWIVSNALAEPPKESALKLIFGALKQAVGKREARPEARAPTEGAVPVRLEAVSGEPPLAAEDETFWQLGMPEPAPGISLRVESPAAPMSTESRLKAHGEKLECPHCYALAYQEEVRERHFRCPSCDHDWVP